jgi:putative membrane protein
MQRGEFIFWVSLVALVSVVTFVGTDDRVNWLLDAGWVAAGVPLLLLTRKRFPLTPLLYRLLVIHALVLIAGGYWTYENNPLGKLVQDWTGSSRNHYDRFGHFLQGFVPAIIFRELFVRASPVTRSGWLSYFVITSCLAFSACFELLEWAATLIAGAGADEFLGHQGDIWDAQWDMLWALIGALAAVVLLSRWHDRELERLKHAVQPRG